MTNIDRLINTACDKEIQVCEIWNADDVRTLCTKRGWFTKGSTKEYNEMLEHVDKTDPTPTNLYIVAADILQHSSDPDLYVEGIMFELSRECVSRFYTVE